MSDTVIRVENLSKKFILGHKQQERYTTLRDVIVNSTKGLLRPFRREKLNTRNSQDDFWALKDISLEIKQGERIGIIGRNGAGKSTLLKVLSRITEPTKGRIKINGRVASLLEVGTGFHPELTGRENIFLNGAILGMSKEEIKRKFDEIVAFAEVEKFLDTPVKHYSSGMYVRLAFAVAAHLEPEILIVDEVLAVGDVKFQKKCLGKMEDVTKTDGKTLIFVSHDMTAIQNLCSSVIHLNNGKVVGIGEASKQIENYLNLEKEQLGLNLNRVINLSSTLKLKKLNFNPNPLISSDSVKFEIQIDAQETTNVSDLQILIYSPMGVRAASMDLRASDKPYRIEANESLLLSGLIKSLPLVEGDYNIGIYINSSSVHSDFYDLSKISVTNKPIEGYIPYLPKYRGVFELEFNWLAKNLRSIDSHNYFNNIEIEEEYKYQYPPK